MSTLEIKDLHVSIEGKEILKGIDLTINTNEIHAIMGPNGNGKSTLLLAIMGHPSYEITEGSILLDGEDITEMSEDERSRMGIFLGMQAPIEIPGITNSDFLRAAVNVHNEEPVSLLKFVDELEQTIDKLDLKQELAHRYLNVGFSGGEKKRNEILQMKMLKPKFALLDEIDSGLDVDALNIVAESVNEMKSDNFGAIIVSHYERLFEMIHPTHVNVIYDGKIVLTGGPELVSKIDKEGYNWIADQFGLEKEEETAVDFSNL